MESEDPHQQSFDISVKGSPTAPCEMLPSESDKNILLSTEKARRDSIACFFRSESSPITSKQGSMFVKQEQDVDVSMELSDNEDDTVTTRKFGKSTFSSMSSPFEIKSSQRAPDLPSRRSTRHRDSIACFFASPKIRSIVTTEPADENDNEMENSNNDSINQQIVQNSSIKEDVSMELDSPKDLSKDLSPTTIVNNTVLPDDDEISLPEDDSFDLSEDVTNIQNTQFESVSLNTTPLKRSPIKTENKSSSKKTRRYSMSPSSLESPKRKSPRSSPNSMIAKAISSPYTPKIRSKLSQNVVTASPEEINSDHEPMTQSDVTTSQSTGLYTFESSQSPLQHEFKGSFKDSLEVSEEHPYDLESNNEDQEDDLMDEHLSILDNSFSQETRESLDVSKPILNELNELKESILLEQEEEEDQEKLLSLNDFFRATQIHFMDEVPISLMRESSMNHTRTGKIHFKLFKKLIKNDRNS